MKTEFDLKLEIAFETLSGISYKNIIVDADYINGGPAFLCPFGVFDIVRVKRKIHIRGVFVKSAGNSIKRKVKSAIREAGLRFYHCNGVVELSFDDLSGETFIHFGPESKHLFKYFNNFRGNCFENN